MSILQKVESVLPVSIYTLLKTEHTAVKGLFQKLINESDPTDTFNKLCTELLAHEKAENEAVYALAEQRLEKSDIEQAQKEQQEAERMLNMMREMDTTNESFKEACQKLKTMVEAHVQTEEDIVFPKMQEKFSDEEAHQMADKFKEIKKQEMDALSSVSA
jgi:hemerythrin superfamily protein